MKRKLDGITTLILPMLLLVSSTASAQKPVWEFSVVVGVSDETVSHYGDMNDIRTLVNGAFAYVNNKFNQNDQFAGEIRFTPSSIYEFTGDPRNEISNPNPGDDYRLIINGHNPTGGGWLGGDQTILHFWDHSFFGGPFDTAALDGLTHEFAHARGAVDLYPLAFPAANNPVSHEAYVPPTSMMTYPYGQTFWDPHTVGLINHFADAGSDGMPVTWFSDLFPSSMGVRVVDTNGNPVAGAIVSIYQLEDWNWDNTNNPKYVQTTPAETGLTDADGEFVLTDNPFGLDYVNAPWSIRHPVTVVEAAFNGAVEYSFMTFMEPQIAAFNGVADYKLEIAVDPPNSALSVFHKAGNSDAPDNNLISPFINIQNNGTTDIYWEDISVEYYLFDDIVNISSLQADKWYFYPGDSDWGTSLSDVSISFVDLGGTVTSGSKSANIMVRIDVSGSHSIAPGGEASLQFAIHTDNWQHNFAELDDWSYTAADGQFNNAGNIVVRDTLSGDILWGSAP